MTWLKTKATNLKRGKIDRALEVKALLETENTEVLKSSAVNSVVYSAVKNLKTEEVFAVVALTKTNLKKEYNFECKMLSEYECPKETGCLESILKTLTPTDNVSANNWRKACWENIENKKDKKKDPNTLSNLKVGSIIEMNHWLEEKPLLKLKKVKKAKYKNPVWFSKETGYTYRTATIESQGYKIISFGI